MEMMMHTPGIIEAVVQVEHQDWLIPELEASTRKIHLLGNGERFEVHWRDWVQASLVLPTPGMWIHARLRAMKVPSGSWMLECYVVLKP